MTPLQLPAEPQTAGRTNGEHNQSVSRNGRLRELEAAIDRAGIDVGLALLTADLAAAGGKLIPPLWQGGWTRVELPDGTTISLSAFRELERFAAILGARCPVCGRHAVNEKPARRGPRVDRRYCGDACKQRAYRQRRKQAGGPKDAALAGSTVEDLAARIDYPAAELALILAEEVDRGHLEYDGERYVPTPRLLADYGQALSILSEGAAG